MWWIIGFFIMISLMALLIAYAALVVAGRSDGMSKMIDERELMQAGTMPESDRLRPADYVSVANTFLSWCGMTPAQRRQLAAKMAAYDAVMADEFAQMIIDAVFPPDNGKLIRVTDGGKAKPSVPADIELWIAD